LPIVKASYKYLAFLGLLLFPTNCSVEKNTATTRFYHGMTARYNIYFNGYESYKAGVLKVNQGYVNDYAELLKVFEFSDPSTSSLCSSEMERAIQKASKLISLKSITAKPGVKKKDKADQREIDLLNRKEYNAWVDDSYLLIGKARFYKQELNEASAVFSYCITQANDPDIRNEASIWLVRIYNEKENYIESFRILTELEITDKSSKVLRSMYYTTFADHYIKQKKYSEAIDPLSKAIELGSGKRSKYRLTYLLAQLNERTGNSANSISLYRKVVKMNPPYDVEFNARINIAGVFDVNAGNPHEIRKELERMLRDVKNKDFLDQIYYALGNLSMKESKEQEALEFFKKSASSHSSNQNQKGRSFLALADYYYKKPDYLKAGVYYDSTVMFLNQKYPDYQLLKSKSQDLNTVVSQLKIIQVEDSLQKVAAMSEYDRNSLITMIINKINQAEIEGKTTEYTSRYNLGQYYENEQRFRGNIDQEGKWYFYNQSALTFGRTEFKRRWGDRKLEDNWRRSNRTIISTAQAGDNLEENTKTNADTSGVMLDYKKPEFYLRNLPLTDSLLAISNEKIANAFLNAGKAYYEKLAEPVKATESFENLLTRYPGNELVPEALYNLYRVNKDINSSKSESYRQRLLEKYPSTEFAKILSDPGYFEKKLADLKIVEQLYEQAYKTYTGEDYASAISQCDDAVKKYSQDQLSPKFMLLRAYCIAKISDERNFKDELSKLIKSFPKSEESKKAGEIIAYLNEKIPELKVEEEKELAQALYVADTTVTHVFALVIADPAFNINQANFDVISYNIDNYTNNNYRTQGELVENKYIMIIVSGFSKYFKAMEYYKNFNLQKLVRNPSGSKVFTFIISNDNMKALNKDKNPERYLLFFKENYLNEKN
jgi:tetratricopeptide (TPR) repeat protein